MDFENFLINNKTKNQALYLNGVFFIESELNLENFLKKELLLNEINIEDEFIKENNFFYIIEKKIEKKMINIKILINFNNINSNLINFFYDKINNSKYIQKKFFNEIRPIDYDLFKCDINIIKLNKKIEKEAKRIINKELSLWKEETKIKYNDLKIKEIIDNIKI